MLRRPSGLLSHLGFVDSFMRTTVLIPLLLLAFGLGKPRPLRWKQ